MDITKKIDRILGEPEKLDEGKIKDMFVKVGKAASKLADKALDKLAIGNIKSLIKMGETPEKIYANLSLSPTEAQTTIRKAIARYVKKGDDADIIKLNKIILAKGLR